MNQPELTLNKAATVSFYGKYRGVVIDSLDPEQIGRVMVRVPDVLGTAPSGWAMPCVPFAGTQAGFFAAPPVGSAVWVEFERGNPDYPIWTGGFWPLSSEVPAAVKTPPAVPPGQNVVLQTVFGNMISISDAAAAPATGGIVLKAAGGAMIVVNETGVYISSGKGAVISLAGPVVSISQPHS